MKSMNLLIFLFFVTTLSQATDRALLIVDASGSMWGQIDGQTKISIAKKAITTMLDDWDTQTQLGLITYGHRRDSDCNDIEMLVPVKAFDKTLLLENIQTIQPKGKTPLGKALQLAADKLQGDSGKTAIIIISDGKENCQVNPCETAKQLRKAGIDLVVHVIGFDVDSDTTSQLACIADATHGEYLAANNIDSLNDAMETIIRNVQIVPASTVIDKPNLNPPQKANNQKYNLEVTATVVPDGERVIAYHDIYQIDDKGLKTYVDYCYSLFTEPCYYQLPIGNYQLESNYQSYQVLTSFVISADNTTELRIAMKPSAARTIQINHLNNNTNKQHQLQNNNE